MTALTVVSTGTNPEGWRAWWAIESGRCMIGSRCSASTARFFSTSANTWRCG